MENNNQAAAPQQIETKQTHSGKHFVYPLVLALVLGVSSVIIYSQHQQIVSLNDKKNAATLTAGKLAEDKTQLVANNANLTKSYATLKSTQPPATSTTVKTTVKAGDTSTVTPLPTASLQINSVHVYPLSHFGTTNSYASNTTRAVQVTMKNLSTANQTYTVGDFKAITDTGEIINATVYTNDPGNGTFWNNSQVAPSGTLQQYVPFNVDKHIVTLEWTPPGSQPIDLAIPADQN